MRIIGPEELPVGIANLAKGHSDRIDLWAVDSEGAYWALRKLNVYHVDDVNPVVPKGIDPRDIVDWYSLPTWVEGSYSNDQEMHRLQSYTWVRGSASTYFAYDERGKYAGMWETE